MSKHDKMDDDKLAEISGAGPFPFHHPVQNPDTDTLKKAAAAVPATGGNIGGTAPELDDIPPAPGGTFTPGQA